MNKTNKNNSIIFLTTLSVYLGLVLVGAPAHVLAQAALASRIEIKDKIEIENDLDNKPDDDFEGFQEIYTEKVFADFVKQLQDLQKSEHYDSIEEEDFYTKRLWFFNSEEPFVSEVPNIGCSNLDKVLAKLLESLDNDSLRSFADFSQDIYPTALNLGIYTNVAGVKLETFFKTTTKQKASVLAGKLNTEFLLRVNKTEDNFAKQIYENTKVLSFDNQIFITTQLPRGSLDALLKQDAKAEVK